MKSNRTLRYLLFGSLYLTQGTILGYFNSLNALYLLSNGLTMTDIGIFSAIALIPFVIKIFLGILSDKVNLFGLGHRKPYIVLGLIIQTLCLIAIPFINPSKNYWLFVSIAFILQLGMAWYDTCTDGLALDSSSEEEESTIQSFMVGGRAIGVIVASLVTGFLAENVSWNSVFWTLAILTLIPFILLPLVKEPKEDEEEKFEWKAFNAFKDIKVIAVSIFGFIVFAAVIGANFIINPFIEQTAGISLSQAGLISTTWGVGVVIGSIIGGFIMKKVSIKKSLIIGVSITSILIVTLSFINSLTVALIIVPLFGIGYGITQTMAFALCMRFTVATIAASMYSILMAVTNIGQGAGMGIAGALTDSIGYRPTFYIYAIFNLFALFFLPLIFKPNNKE